MKKGIDRCVYCGCSEPLYLTVDHKIPKALGGKNTPDNLQTCCIVCNQIKANRTEEEFKAVMKHLRGLNKHK
jgi:5-methylcytosine-specific restriction endonuclease McrA